MKWKDPIGYSCYHVSEYGHVRLIREPPSRNKRGIKFNVGDLLNPRVLGPKRSKYLAVVVWPDGSDKPITQCVHRLVALAFLPPPKENEYLVRHLDDDRNNSHYSNLQWGDDRLNAFDSIKNGNIKNHSCDEIEVRLLRAEFKSRKAAGEKCVKVKMARERNLNYWNMRDMLNGKRYAWVQ